MATISINGTYYQFTVTSANATVGATYTNNGVTYTVNKTIAAGTILVCTAAAGSVTSGATLTKASGTGDATITFSAVSLTLTNDNFTYAAGDTLNFSGNQNWTITQTLGARPGPINMTTNASTSKLLLSNTSTSVPLIFDLNAQTSDISISYATNSFDISGDWIVLATGDGTISQTLDFTSLVSGAIDWPSAVWVEAPNQYWFTCSSSTASVGDTYTESGNTYTVMTAISGGTTLYCSNYTGDPSASGTLTRATGAGSATIAYTAYVKEANTKYYSMTVGGTAGYWLPFQNIGNGTGSNVAPDYDVQNIKLLTEGYGDMTHWPMFSYDSTSKIATFGKGGAVASSLGGCVIPNGARVIYPNIHITSSTYDANSDSRNRIDFELGAKATWNIVGTSHNIGWSNGTFISGSGPVTITSLATTGRWSNLGNFLGTVVFENLVVAPDASAATSASYTIRFNNFRGDLYLNHIYAFLKTTTTSSAVTVQNSVALKQFSNIFGWQIGIGTSSAYVILLESVLIPDGAPLSIGPLYPVGGFVNIRYSANMHITEIYHSDQTSAAASTSSSYAANFTGSKDMTIAKLRKLTSGVAPRTALILTDSSSIRIAVKDIDYDGQNNTGYAFSLIGERSYASNVYLPNARSTLHGGTSSRNDVRYANMYSNAPVANTVLPGGARIAWTMNSSGVYSGTTQYDAEPFNTIWTNSSKTAGRLIVGPLSRDDIEVRTTIVTGTEGTDFWFSGNGFYAPNTGVEVIFTNLYPVQGITDFTGNSVSFTHTGFTTNAAIEVSMRVNDGTDTSTWSSWYDVTTASNWQTCLASLTGYTSDAGFYPRFRLTTTGASSTRVYNYGYTTCTPDSAWTPAEIGFVPITVSGHVANSCVALYDNTVPATPVLVKKEILSSTADEVMDFPYDFDATAKDYLMVLRKSGYGEASISGSTYQQGTNAPFSQVLYTTIVDATASAITGISVDGATNTVTITGDNTYQDIHQYLQWWGAQVANMGYEIPSTTTDNVNYSSLYDFTVNTGVTISGTGTLTLTGGAILTMTGTAQSGINITHTSGTKVWTRIALNGITSNSRVRIYNTTDSTEIYNDVVSGTSLEYQLEYTADKTLNIRAVYVDGTGAKLPWEQVALFTNSGISVVVEQSDDDIYIENAIDGSTVTEFDAYYPTLYVNIDDPDGYGYIKRLYAWFQNNLMTESGISNFFGGITAVDTVNYIIEKSIVDLYFYNVGIPVYFRDANIESSDLTEIIADGSNSIFFRAGLAHIANTDDIADAILDQADGAETGITPRQAMRLVLASSAGKLSGAGTTQVKIRNVIDNKDRITATVDSVGNRTSVTVDGT